MLRGVLRGQGTSLPDAGLAQSEREPLGHLSEVLKREGDQRP